MPLACRRQAYIHSAWYNPIDSWSRRRLTSGQEELWHAVLARCVARPPQPAASVMSPRIGSGPGAGAADSDTI